jgi:DNA-binding MarR family transcriptional regulator
MKVLTQARKNAFMLFLGAHSCLTDAMETELREADLVPLAVYDVLVTLEMSDGGTMRMSELASHVLYSRSGLT